MTENVVRGYKVFDENWKSIYKQYHCPGEFTEDCKPVLCKHGMHFCRKLADCFRYYDFNPKNKVAEVEAFGDIVYDEDDRKCCTNKLRIVRELSWHEVLDLCNMGNGNTGFGNTGFGNSGDNNSGGYNSGYRNCGYRNTGDFNSGNFNSGDNNSGHHNSGHCNAGNFNSGNFNSGNWNSGNFNSGFFNSENQPFYMFNKIAVFSKGDINDAIDIMNVAPETAKDRQSWWDALPESDKELVMSLPNFDADVFEKCTMIKVVETDENG